MVFSKITEFILAAPKSLRASSPLPYISAGASSPTNYSNGFRFGSSEHVNNLRHSFSLQDMSTYNRVDAEDGKHTWKENSAHSLSFSKEKALQGTPSLRKRWFRWFLVLVCLLLFAFLVFLLIHYYFTYWSTGASKYYVVLDCGSTGTRVYIYEASINHRKNDNLPLVLKSFSEFRKKPNEQNGRAYDRMETEPGLDKLVHNKSGVKTAIKPLLQWAEKQIPKHLHKTTSLFLYATAGVRRLPSQDSKWLLDNVWNILKHSPFLCQREWVNIITGMEEAYYGWIALNYQTHVLGAVPKQATYGALDLGGSSLQVTFETQKPEHRETNLNLSIGPVNHHLSAFSLSGYGLNDAFDKSVVRLLRSLPKVDSTELSSGKVEIKHPCLQSGYKEKYTCSQCASVYQESGGNLIDGKMKVKKGKGGKPGVPVWLIGAPNWLECSALAKTAVNFSEWSNVSSALDCDVEPCALSKDLPRPFGQFYAMSGFFVVYRFFNLSAEATLDDVLEKGHAFCDQTWEVARKSVPPQPFIEQYCFRAPYVTSLLREGLHITDKQINIGSGGITWTLGVALVEAGKGFSTRPPLRSYEIFQMRINPVFLFFLLLMSSILLVFALSCVGKSVRRFFRRLHLPMFRHNGASANSGLNIPSPFRLQRWSPMNGDGRVKTPLSPTAGEQSRPFGAVHWFAGSNMKLSETSRYAGTGSVPHSISTGSLGQMQVDNNGIGPIWPHRSRLQSRRSQSREDLMNSIADAKV